MIPAALALPFVSAGLNRKWRGEAGAPRWVWYSFMTIMGYVVTFDPYFTLIWLLFLLGYAMAPWQAMFAAITGVKPGRDDSWAFQWMQTVTYNLCGMTSTGLYTQNDWYRFGKVYGAIRALPMMPSIFMFCGYTGSLMPLTGLLFLGMGYVYYLGGKTARALNASQLSVAIPEVIMGWCIVAYMLLCSW